MELLALLCFIGILAFTIFYIRKKTIAFNKKSIDNFGFQPIQLKYIYCGGVPLTILFLGGLLDGRTGSLNTIVAILLSVFGIIYCYRYIKNKTDKSTANKAILILLLYGSIVPFAVIFYICLWLLANSSADDNSYYNRYSHYHWW